MDESIKIFTQNLIPNNLLDPVQYNSLIESVDCKFPPDYLAFMKEYNGGEGVIKEGRYVRFWPLEELKEANEDYMVEEFAPDLFFIGSDGGGTAFGLNKITGIFIEVPFIGISNEAAIERGKDFVAFLSFLAEQ